MQKITAVIPAKNEENNIESCIKSLKWCDEIIVISTGNDGTASRAEKMGARVIKKINKTARDFEALQINFNDVISDLKSDWVMRVDADEIVTEELKSEIREILDHPDKDIVGYGIPRSQYFLGTFLRGGDWAYDRLVRLFRPKFCRYEPIVKVHEQLKMNGKIGYLNNRLLHYSHRDFKTLINKFNTYTSLEAKELNETKFSAFIKMLVNPPYIFLRWFIYHKGYLDGIIGAFAGIMRGYYDFLLYFKYLTL